VATVDEALSITNLHAWYGESHILHDVSLTVNRGEVVTLLGRNGAGRTTTLRAIMGLVGARRGSIRIDGEEAVGLPTYKIARRGVGYCPEERGIFSSLTTEENLLLPPVVSKKLSKKLSTKQEGMSLDEIYGMFPNLAERRHSQGTRLSGGEQQMLAVARGLLARPEILLLDEPSLGLAPAVVAELFEQFTRLRDEGMTLLIVDQMADYALAIADRGYLLGGGRVIAEGSPAELRGAMLDDTYLGSAS
jgi:branched-chain amino acid transport system ATP-binding protein